MGYFLIPHSLWPTPFGVWVLLDYGFFLLQPILLLFSTVFAFLATPFCHSCYDVIRPKPTRHLFGPAAYSSLNDSVWSLGFLLYCLRAPVSHFLLGILGPFTFLGHPRPFLILCSYGLLLTPLGFPDPITLSFICGAYGFSINPLLCLLALLWACRSPFSLFCITCCP